MKTLLFRLFLFSLLATTFQFIDATDLNGCTQGGGTGEYRWTNLPIGGGGYVTGILIHPSHKDTIYIRTDVAGIFSFNREEKGSQNHPEWQPLFDWIPYENRYWFGVDGFAIDPNDPNTIYAHCGMYPDVEYADMLKSTDAGKTWKACGLHVRARANQSERYYGESVLVDPRDHNHIWVGTRFDGLWESSDAGTNWSQVSGSPEDPEGHGLRSLAFDSHSETLYIGIPEMGVYALRQDQWTHLPTCPKHPCRLAVTPNGRLLMTAKGGVYAWDGKQFETITPQQGLDYLALAIDPIDENRILCAQLANQFDVAIFLSIDGGKHWRNLAENRSTLHHVPWYPDGWFGSAIASIAFDPHTPGRVYFTDWYTIWKTDAIDATPLHWESVPWGHEELCMFDMASPPIGARLYNACADNGGLRHDTLDTYPTIKFGYQETTGIDFCEQSPEVLVRVSSNDWGLRDFKLSVSHDAGTSWKEVLETKSTGKVAMSATNPDVFLFAPTGHGQQIIATQDGGVHFSVSEGLPATTFNEHFWDNYNQPLRSDRVDDCVFYVYINGVFYRSEDGGVHFEEIYNGLPIGGGVVLETSPVQSGELWLALQEGGLFYSSNGGDSFELLPGWDSVTAITAGPGDGGTSECLYAYGNLNGEWAVWRSDDKGNRWRKISNDQQRMGADVKVLEADRQSPGLVYVGTNGRGIFYGKPE